MKKLNSVFAILFVLTILLCPVLSLRQNSFSIATVESSAKAFCVMEATTKRVLNAKNEHEKRAMASTTKIMTAITAIENCENLDEKFEISKKSIGISGTSLYLKEGEMFSIRELLYGLMLISGNDASVAIGERVGGKVEFFVDMMNQKAKDIGAFDTHFENTHGLDSEGHYTTAYDLALISSYAMQNAVFKEIVSTQNKVIVNQDGKERYLKNKNKLLKNYAGANGVKTGFTDDAGRCFVGSAVKNGMNVVCSILSCGPMFEDCEKLLDEAFENYSMIDVTEKVYANRTVKVEDGKEKEIVITPSEKFYFPLKKYEISNLKYEIFFPESIEAPLSKGEEIGEIKIFLNNDLLFSLKFTTINDVETKGVLERFFDILNRW